MGRTVPTFRSELDILIAKWTSYRRALCSRDREAFDALMNKAWAHASASSYAAMEDPVEPVMLSMLVEMQKEIDNLKKRIADENAPAR